MTGVELEAVVLALPSYDIRQEKQEALSHAAEAKPRVIHDGSPVRDLEAQIAYVKAAEKIALPAAEGQLRVDIAMAKDSIPLPYRLGMLTAMDNPLDFEKPFDRADPEVKAVFGDPSLPEFTLPPRDSFERAAKIGAVILETADKLGDDQLTPMVQLSLIKNMEAGSLLEYTWRNLFMAKELRRGGFIVSEPHVQYVQEEADVVRYSLPTLRCLDAYLKPGNEFAPTDSDRRRYGSTIRIPQLRLLEQGAPQRNDFLEKLLVGEDAITYVNDRWPLEDQEQV